MNKKELGKFGEEAAAEYLKLQGYEILALNFRCRLGEVDIICKKDNQIVFCEVKTRTTDACGTPGEAVTEAKKDKIRKVAAVYMMWEKRILGGIDVCKNIYSFSVRDSGKNDSC